MKINKNITEVNRTKRQSRDVRYIVVHYTGNKNDTAYGNTRYFKSVNRSASAHYFVDENEIWQCVEDNDIAWHCGAKRYVHAVCRNANSIGVEMCSSVSRNAAVERNTAELVRYLMRKYNVSADRVLRHYDVTGKQCPITMINENVWREFKDSLKEEDSMTDAEKAKMKAIDDSLTNLYRIVEEQKRTIDALIEEIRQRDAVYNTVDEVPEWGRAAVQRLIDAGRLSGTGDGLALSADMVRLIAMLG